MIRSSCLVVTTLLLAAQMGCSSSSSSGGTGGPVPGCTQPGTYSPMATRSTTDPGTCPLDAELPIEWEQIEVEPTDEVCGSDRVEGTGDVSSSSGDHCAYSDTL